MRDAGLYCGVFYVSVTVEGGRRHKEGGVGWFGVGPAPLDTPFCGEGLGLAFSLICYYDGWTRAMSHIAIRHGKGMHMVVFGCVQPAVCTVRSLSGARFPASLHHSLTHI